MGCDGGSIPKRKEIVKSKQKDEGKDKQADLAAKWHFCALSGLPLNRPIVACPLGRLYNKDAIIQHLLNLKAPTNFAPSSSNNQSPASHIKSLKDVKELKLKDKPDFDLKAHQTFGGKERFRAQFVCPISGLDLSGRYKFFYSSHCGCVISEKALREVPDDNQCIWCSKPHNPKTDLIVINGDSDEVEELKTRLAAKRSATKLSKKKHKVSDFIQDDPKGNNGTSINEIGETNRNKKLKVDIEK